MIKIVVLLLWVGLGDAQECVDGCRQGPVRMAPYVCRCPYRPTRDELTPCILHCSNDFYCRFCPGDPWYNIPSLCPLALEETVDLSGDNFELVFEKGIKIYGIDKATSNEQMYFDPQTIVVHAPIDVPELTIEGEYKLNGILCGNTSVRNKGSLSIKFETVIVDWHPRIELIQKCNQTYFQTNGPLSNVTLVTSNPVRFQLTPDRSLSKCLNDNWMEVYGRIKEKLEAAVNKAETYFTNSLTGQSPITEIFDFNA